MCVEKGEEKGEIGRVGEREKREAGTGSGLFFSFSLAPSAVSFSLPPSAVSSVGFELFQVVYQLHDSLVRSLTHRFLHSN